MGVEDISDNKPVKDIIASVKEAVVKYRLQEHEIITSLWNTVMSTVEWNKKEELVAEQALKHLKQYSPLFAAFTQTSRSELTLLVRVQEFCYENMNFMKVFQKVVLLFYKTDVLSEDVIIKWYKEGHSVKGKSVFLEQMSKFIEWLQSAEEDCKRQYSAVSPLTRNVVSNSLHCCQPCCNRNIPPFFNNVFFLLYSTCICRRRVDHQYQNCVSAYTFDFPLFFFFYLNFLPFSFISSFGCGV